MNQTKDLQKELAELKKDIGNIEQMLEISENPDELLIKKVSKKEMKSKK